MACPRQRNSTPDVPPPLLPKARPLVVGETLAKRPGREKVVIIVIIKHDAVARRANVLFFPSSPQDRSIEWDYSSVSNVHCGRLWRFHRFVPPSLMSALISRFYGKGKAGSTELCRNGVYVRVPLKVPAPRGSR